MAGTVRCARAYVANFNDGITVYEAAATGNAKPVQHVTGSGVNGPDAVAVDASGNMYVSNYNGNSVTVFAAGATGAATPVRTITGPDTGLNIPAGVAWTH